MKVDTLKDCCVLMKSKRLAFEAWTATWELNRLLLLADNFFFFGLVTAMALSRFIH